VDNDHRFDKIRKTPELQAARQTAMACRERYAHCANLKFD
jgi:hypothetical protein